MIKSWTAWIISIILVVMLSFIKVFVPAYPFTEVGWLIATITGAYFGKRVIQKHKKFTNYQTNKGGE